jgi:outer membrane protein assembly factor BamB
MMERRKLIQILVIEIIVLLLVAGVYFILYSEEEPKEEVKPGSPDFVVPEFTWPQYRLTVNHNGVTHANASLKGTLVQVWSSKDINIESYTASKSSPAVDSELIFVGADSGKLHTFWRSNGTEVWSFQTRPSKNGIHGSPAVDSEKVYIGAYDGYLYGLYKNNGTVAWENKLGDYIGSSPCLYKGVVYIGVEMKKPAGYLVGCDMDSGEEVFRSGEFGSHPHSTPSIDPEREYIYIGANDNVLYCYDLNSEKEVWNFTSNGDIKSTPCLADDLMYVTSWDNRIYALDMTTGEKQYEFRTGMRTMSSPAIDSAGERVYFGSHDEYIYCIDARNGKELWKFKTGARIQSSPIILEGDGIIVCGSNDGFVYFLDMATGAKRQNLYFEVPVTSTPVVVRNQLYIFDDEGILYRFDAD